MDYSLMDYTLLTRDKAVFDYKSECGETFEVTIERMDDGYSFTDPYFINVPDDEHGDYEDIVEEVFYVMNKQN